MGGSTEEEETSEEEMSTEDEEACLGWMYMLSVVGTILFILFLTVTKLI